ncbi:GntR family transcriptional regulator [Propionivibrio soli]|uniref:GntR family transcriptional regulator n=1 Tax=Propionivibrio soli TaxID=2976531 RepID=UPI0021E8EC2C|nr:GntR family transcriptional regulator [Propionivibrio soli]
MTYPVTLELLKTHSLPSLVQEELERMILDGRLVPGEQLREIPLAALLGVSRGPIREAFRALEEKGLVMVVKNCGVYVRTLDIEEADQIYEVRLVLERLIGEKVTRRIDEQGLQSLRETVSGMRDAVEDGDVTRYTGLNIAFHDTLARLTGNLKLHATYARLVGELSLFRRQTYVHDEQSLAISFSEHQTILNAIVERRAGEAGRLLQKHASDSQRRLHRALSS